MTDPAAIDLVALKVKLGHGPLKSYDILPLIAAVEALRERVAELEGDCLSLKWAGDRVIAAEAAADTRLAELKRLIDKVPS